MGMAAAYGADLAAVCGAADAPAEGGCWQPLENRRNCHVWNSDSDPQPGDSATFEGQSGCRDGKLSGNGAVHWRTFKDDGALTSFTHTGPYIDGKLDGRVIQTGPGGWRSEGNMVDGEPNGHWVLRNYDDDGKLTHEQQGSFVGGKRHGDWILNQTQYLHWGATYQYKSSGAYDHGKRHGEWVLVRYYMDTDDGTHSSHKRQEGSYVTGQKHGHWVEVEHPGDVILRDGGAHADGDAWIQSEGSYLEGKKDGM